MQVAPDAAHSRRLVNCKTSYSRSTRPGQNASNRSTFYFANSARFARVFHPVRIRRLRSAEASPIDHGYAFERLNCQTIGSESHHVPTLAAKRVAAVEHNRRFPCDEIPVHLNLGDQSANKVLTLKSLGSQGR